MRKPSWSAALLVALLASGPLLARAGEPSDFDPRGLPGGSMSDDNGITRYHAVGSPNTDTAGGGLSPVEAGVLGLDKTVATPGNPEGGPPPGINPSGTGQAGVPDRTPDNFFPLGRPPGR